MLWSSTTRIAKLLRRERGGVSNEAPKRKNKQPVKLSLWTGIFSVVAGAAVISDDVAWNNWTSTEDIIWPGKDEQRTPTNTTGSSSRNTIETGDRENKILLIYILIISTENGPNLNYILLGRRCRYLEPPFCSLHDPIIYEAATLGAPRNFQEPAMMSIH